MQLQLTSRFDNFIQYENLTIVSTIEVLFFHTEYISLAPATDIVQALQLDIDVVAVAVGSIVVVG